MKREEQKDLTRRKILQAAAQCFAQNGYSGCSVQDIIDLAGISKGCLYGHFKSKADLFKEMISIEHNSGSARALKAKDNPPYVEAILNFMTECISNAGFPMDHRLWAEVLAVAARDAEMKEFFLKSEKITRGFVKELLQKAKDAGEIDKSLDLEAVSIWIFALGDGLIVRIADDPHFDFKKELLVFRTLVRKALT